MAEMALTLHALLVACQEGDVARVTHILDSGEVGINAPDESEITALQVTEDSSIFNLKNLLVLFRTVSKLSKDFLRTLEMALTALAKVKNHRIVL